MSACFLYIFKQKAFNNYTLSYCNIRELASSLSTTAQIATRQAAVDAFNQVHINPFFSLEEITV